MMGDPTKQELIHDTLEILREHGVELHGPHDMLPGFLRKVMDANHRKWHIDILHMLELIAELFGPGINLNVVRNKIGQEYLALERHHFLSETMRVKEATVKAFGSLNQIQGNVQMIQEHAVDSARIGKLWWALVDQYQDAGEEGEDEYRIFDDVEQESAPWPIPPELPSTYPPAQYRRTTLPPVPDYTVRTHRPTPGVIHAPTRVSPPAEPWPWLKARPRQNTTAAPSSVPLIFRAQPQTPQMFSPSEPGQIDSTTAPSSVTGTPGLKPPEAPVRASAQINLRADRLTKSHEKARREGYSVSAASEQLLKNFIAKHGVKHDPPPHYAREITQRRGHGSLSAPKQEWRSWDARATTSPDRDWNEDG